MAGHSEVDRGGAVAGGDLVHLGEFVVGGGEADLQALGFAGPAFALGLAGAGDQVVADLGQPWPLGGVGPQQRAADAGVLVDAGGGVGAAAGAQRQLAPFEVAEELGPFLIGGDAVFLGGT